MRIVVDDITVPAGTHSWYTIEELPLSLKPLKSSELIYFSGYDNNTTTNAHMEFTIKIENSIALLRILALHAIESQTDTVVSPRAIAAYVSS